MKTFTDLSEKEQAIAIEVATIQLLGKICDGKVRFADPALQTKIETAAKDAERMKTPWFMHEFVIETCKEEVTRAAKIDAERAYYREQGDLILSI